MDALEHFESVSDAVFVSHPLPHPNQYVATWYLLTVAEDSQRNMLVLPEEPAPQWRVEHYQDRFKFSLRSCLARVRKESSDRTAMPLPNKALEKLYVRAQNLLFAGIDYSVATQICSSAHNGSARIDEDASGFRVEIVEGFMDKRYGALEGMRQSGKDVVVAYSMLLWYWILQEAERPAVVWHVMESTRLRERRVHYTYDPVLAYDLSQAMPQAPEIIPQGWVFPWGGRYETTLLLNSLSLRLLYHAVAVNFGASKHRLRGGAEHDLCLVLTRDEWVNDLALMSSLEPARIKTFIDYLTFGNKTQSPDQVLQPFVPLGNSRLGVGPLGWLSSNVERNLLSLQARLEPKEFNGQSSLFEVGMTTSLMVPLRERWPLVAANRTFSLPEGKEEIDVLICEPDTQTVAVLELRWMLPPADPREIQQRKEACWSKVQQAMRKADAVRRSLPLVLRTAFDVTDVVPSDWTVGALVVIEGFGGARSLDDSVPVVPEWVLEAGIAVAPTLRRLIDWAAELEWLPREGREFEVIDCEPHYDDVKLTYPGLVPLRNGMTYLKDATAALVATES